MTRDQKMDMYCFIVLSLVGVLISAYALFRWGQWTYSLVALHDYIPDPFGLFEEDSPLVDWLLSL